MRRILAIAGILAFALAIAASAWAQDQRRGMMGMMYDPKTEITIQGVVEKVDRMGRQNMPGMGGIHLTLKARDETYDVHLGPAAFVEKTMTLKAGDTIQVIGSKMTMMGKTAFMAREVTKDGQVLKLRDDRGMPMWSGMGRRAS